MEIKTTTLLLTFFVIFYRMTAAGNPVAHRRCTANPQGTRNNKKKRGPRRGLIVNGCFLTCGLIVHTIKIYPFNTTILTTKRPRIKPPAGVTDPLLTKSQR